MEKLKRTLVLAPLLAAEAACGARTPPPTAPAPFIRAPAALVAPVTVAPELDVSADVADDQLAIDPTRCEDMTADTDEPEPSGLADGDDSRAPSEPPDALDASTIRNVVRRHADGFMGCYQLGLGRDPHLQGRVTTRFDIDRRGKIAVWTVAANELPDCAVLECIRDHFITIVFPPPGNVVTVLYPLVFGHAD